MELTTSAFLTPKHADAPFLSLDVSGLRVSTYIMADKPEELRAFRAFRASLVKAIEDVDALLAVQAKPEPVPTTDHDDRMDTALVHTALVALVPGEF